MEVQGVHTTTSGQLVDAMPTSPALVKGWREGGEGGSRVSRQARGAATGAGNACRLEHAVVKQHPPCGPTLTTSTAATHRRRCPGTPWREPPCTCGTVVLSRRKAWFEGERQARRRRSALTAHGTGRSADTRASLPHRHRHGNPPPQTHTLSTGPRKVTSSRSSLCTVGCLASATCVGS